MSHKHQRAEILVSAFLGALAGVFVGFVWSSGILELVAAPQNPNGKPNPTETLTSEQYQARMVRYPLGGAAAGAVLGAATGFYLSRRKSVGTISSDRLTN